MQTRLLTVETYVGLALTIESFFLVEITCWMLLARTTLSKLSQERFLLERTVKYSLKTSCLTLFCPQCTLITQMLMIEPLALTLSKQLQPD